MGFLSRLSTTVAPARLKASAGNTADPFYGLYGAYLPPSWYGSLTEAGVNVTPDLAMTLSAFYCGVSTISYDLSTLPVQVFARHAGDEGKDRLRPFFGAGIDSSNGIRSLAYMLRWQPNAFQSATEFFLSFIPQLLLRESAYAEIVSGTTGFIEQLIPRHPDRIQPQRLPNGRMRYTLTEANGTPRPLTQDEMFVVRGMSLDAGLSGASRVAYGANAIGTHMAADKAAAKFFKSGMTAAAIASYKGGQMEETEEQQLHQSITRYATGAENNFGLLLVPDEISIDTNLGVEPDKAQMMLAREWGVLDVARLLRIDPGKLMIKTESKAGSASEQDEIKHVSNCLRPIAYLIEQAIQRDLILVKDAYFAEFLLEAKLRGDTAARAAYYSSAISAPWMWPSEVRIKENMNPDPALDELAKVRYRPGTPRTSPDGTQAPANGGAFSGRAGLKAMLAIHDNAVRCVRRERHMVTQLAKKHASDVEGWQVALRDFYVDQAAFVAQTMRLDPAIARAYAAQHGTEFESKGIVLISDEWERFEADELAALSLDGDLAAA